MSVKIDNQNLIKHFENLGRHSQNVLIATIFVTSCQRISTLTISAF
jgi:hypothetical protein